MEVAKLLLTAGATATRRAAAMADRWRNIVGGGGQLIFGGGEMRSYDFVFGIFEVKSRDAASEVGEWWVLWCGSVCDESAGFISRVVAGGPI